MQYIREQQAAVERFTGKRAASSVPEKFLHEADEIEVVDAPPDLTMGDPRVLAELRELALLLAADVVDRQLQDYLDSHGVSRLLGRAGAHPRLSDAAQQRPRHAAKADSATPAASTARCWSPTWNSPASTPPTGHVWTNTWPWRGNSAPRSTA